MLDDLYWVMSYSRWKDDAFWPAFRDLLKHEHPQLTDRPYKAQHSDFSGSAVPARTKNYLDSDAEG
jgi:hypothetical protein